MLHTILTAIIAGLTCAVLIIAIHGLLWHRHWRLSRPQAYTVGTACIGIVLTIWALLLNQPETIIGFWAIAGLAGSADLVAWWIRSRLQRIETEAEAAGFIRGQIVGLDNDGQN